VVRQLKHKNRSNKNNGKGKCKIKENKMKLIEWQNRRIVKNNKNAFSNPAKSSTGLLPSTTKNGLKRPAFTAGKNNLAAAAGLPSKSPISKLEPP